MSAAYMMNGVTIKEAGGSKLVPVDFRSLSNLIILPNEYKMSFYRGIFFNQN